MAWKKKKIWRAGPGERFYSSYIIDPPLPPPKRIIKEDISIGWILFGAILITGFCSLLITMLSLYLKTC